MRNRPYFLQLHREDTAALAAEATQGLQAAQPTVSPKFFYDELGSRLFEAITALDAYYPTRTERSIFQAHGEAMAQAVRDTVGQPFTMVDLGAGNCAKAASLFESLQPARYVAVDISVDFLRSAIDSLQRQHPDLHMVGLGMDFSSQLSLPAGVVEGRALMFYPGSSIGNFAPDEALRLLREARAAAQGGALLIGVDWVKDKAVLDLAYDDPLGVTAAFNLNLLNHLNRLIGSDFDVRQWRHVGAFNASASRIEMHLEARAGTEVRWTGGERRFAAGERIHTENSYKWTLPRFEALLREAGFARTQAWTDPQGWFGVVLASG